MTQYKHTVGSSSNTGTLTWNANGTLQQLAISDTLNPGDTQTCYYLYDDLVRLIQAENPPGGGGTCGRIEHYTYDGDGAYAFGNLRKRRLRQRRGV